MAHCTVEPVREGTVLAFGALIGMPLIFGVAGLVVGGLVGAVGRLFTSDDIAAG